jgi:hypothetical protein
LSGVVYGLPILSSSSGVHWLSSLARLLSLSIFPIHRSNKTVTTNMATVMATAMATAINQVTY